MLPIKLLQQWRRERDGDEEEVETRKRQRGDIDEMEADVSVDGGGERELVTGGNRNLRF